MRSGHRRQSVETDLAAIKADTSSQLLSVLNDADRQGVAIFPLALPSGDPKRLPLPDPSINAMYAAARTRLQLLADRTGGRLHEIKRLDQLSILYAQVAADLRTLYSISYQAQIKFARRKVARDSGQVDAEIWWPAPSGVLRSMVRYARLWRAWLTLIVS
jgi:hypothetical protein